MLNSNNNIKKQSKVMIFHPTSTYRATVVYGIAFGLHRPPYSDSVLIIEFLVISRWRVGVGPHGYFICNFHLVLIFQIRGVARMRRLGHRPHPKSLSPLV